MQKIADLQAQCSANPLEIYCLANGRTHRSFKHPHSGKTIAIKGVITCTTTGVIYLLTCPCGKAYVGMTKRELKVCIAEHCSTIRCKHLNYPDAAHFSEANHPVSSLRYIGIEKVIVPRRGGNIETLLLKREASWIYALKTFHPGVLTLTLISDRFYRPSLNMF